MTDLLTSKGIIDAVRNYATADQVSRLIAGGADVETVDEVRSVVYIPFKVYTFI